jgi:hypothetical protein
MNFSSNKLYRILLRYHFFFGLLTIYLALFNEKAIR